MIEKLKKIVLEKLNEELEEYNKVKNQYEQMAEKIKEDNSDAEYDKQKKQLKKEYGMKRFSKKSEYEKELQKIENNYQQNLKQFQLFYDEYTKVKQKLARWDIYRTKRTIKEISKCKTLRDLHMSKEKIESFISEMGLEDSLTEEERKQLEKLR